MRVSSVSAGAAFIKALRIPRAHFTMTTSAAIGLDVGKLFQTDVQSEQSSQIVVKTYLFTKTLS